MKLKLKIDFDQNLKPDTKSLLKFAFIDIFFNRGNLVDL
jgi:hypothetical protein